MQKNMQHVHNVRCIRSDFARLVCPLATHGVRCRILLVDSLLVLAAAVLSLEFLNAVRVSLQLVRYLRLMEFPGSPLSESWVVFLCVQIDNVAEDCHQRKEEAENVMSERVSTMLRIKGRAR
jgi:hypothetical protein